MVLQHNLLIQSYSTKINKTSSPLSFPEPIYLYIMNGKGKLCFSEGFDNFKNKKLYYIPSWKTFKIEANSQNSNYLIIKIPLNSTTYPIIKNPYGFEYIEDTHGEYYSLIDLGLKHQERGYFDVTQDIINGLHHLFMHQFINIKCQSNLSPVMKGIDYYIHNHLNKDIKIEDLSSRSNLSLSQFSHRFKKEFGIAPYQYIKQKRLELAYEMISHTSLSNKEIMNQINYRSESHFQSEFKRYFHVSPFSLRKNKNIYRG